MHDDWFLSDDGSDDNDCHSVSAPCRNLQTVLDRATDGADIYVTSKTLSLDIGYFYLGFQFYKCVINSSLSYTLRGYENSTINVTCSGTCLFLYFLF